MPSLMSKQAHLELLAKSRRPPRVVTDAQRPEYGKDNSVFTQSRYEAAKQRLLAKSNRMSSGIDVTAVADLAEIVGFHLEANARADNTHRALQHVQGIGSPPRAWGQPSMVAPYRPGRRFTPTRVGTTHQPLPA